MRTTLVREDFGAARDSRFEYDRRMGEGRSRKAPAARAVAALLTLGGVAACSLAASFDGFVGAPGAGAGADARADANANAADASTADATSVGDAGNATSDAAGLDAATDAGACADDAPFGPPSPLTIVNSSNDDSQPHLTADELVLVFFSDRPGGPGQADIYVSTRASRDAQFSVPVPLANVNTPSAEYDPDLSPDGLTLYLSSTLGAVGGQDLYVTKRTSIAADFAVPTLLPNVNTPAGEYQPCISADGNELLFARDTDAATINLFHSAMNNGTPQPAAEITALSGNTTTWSPALSFDLLTLYFSTDRSSSQPLIYVARRATSGVSFTAPQPVPELDKLPVTNPGWISPDRCRIYFSTINGGATGEDIWMAERAH
jgi:hypothetical protein